MDKYTKKICNYLEPYNIKPPLLNNNLIINKINDLFKEEKTIPPLISSTVLSIDKANNDDIEMLVHKNEFMSKDNKILISSHKLVNEIYENDKIRISLFYPENDKDDKPDLKMIVSINELLKKLSNSKSKMNLIIFYGNQKKYFPMSKDDILGKRHVNSGFSISGTVIVMWRKEDFYKVLIHEMIHYYEIDAHGSSSIYNKIDTIFNDNIKVKNNDAKAESYVEILAMIIHTVIMARLYETTFDEIFKCEFSFALFQVAKILNFWNINDFSELFKKYIKQHSSICSYYIIKVLYLTNIEKLLLFWEKNGFMVGKEIIPFYKSLFDVSENPYISYINQFIEETKKDKTNKFVFRTLKMIAYQI
jgi:hypothetical protein